MNKLKSPALILFILAIFGIVFIFQKNIEKDKIFQVSTINALMEGVYDGGFTLQDISQHGDFGIGTFNALNGEMVILDGKFYQIKSDGIAYLANKSTKTPFASITNFEPDKTLYVENIENYDQLKTIIDKKLPTKNIFYALKITGDFDYIKTRSVPKQNKPYKTLVEVTKTQPEFEMNNIKGTIVGFILPDFVEKINVPGFHLHFISNDKRKGGHLLKCKIKNARIEIDYTYSLDLNLPRNEAFYKTNIAKNSNSDLNKAEK